MCISKTASVSHLVNFVRVKSCTRSSDQTWVGRWSLINVFGKTGERVVTLQFYKLHLDVRRSSEANGWQNNSKLFFVIHSQQRAVWTNCTECSSYQQIVLISADFQAQFVSSLLLPQLTVTVHYSTCWEPWVSYWWATSKRSITFFLQFLHISNKAKLCHLFLKDNILPNVSFPPNCQLRQ